MEPGLVLSFQAALEVLHCQRDRGLVVCFQHRHIYQFIAGEGIFSDPEFIGRGFGDISEGSIPVLVEEHPLNAEAVGNLADSGLGEAGPEVRLRLVVAWPLTDNHTARAGIQAVVSHSLDQPGVGNITAIGSFRLVEVGLDEHTVPSCHRLFTEVVERAQKGIVIIIFDFNDIDLTHRHCLQFCLTSV
ncbi:MAG: hypothetical protein AMJ70_04130, partial [Dehalococcoidia bacterium SG8_51_3]